MIEEIDDEWDSDAIGVWVEKGGIFSNKRYNVGILPNYMANNFRRWISEGKKVQAKIKNLEVGAKEGIPTGVFLEIKISK